MLSAYHGHADLVKLLIKHGADPNRLNDRGQSPLAGAVFKAEDVVVEVDTPFYTGSVFCSAALTYARSFWKAELIQIMGRPQLWSAS
jgi:hypothetical protein